jgi:uncharacterized protein YqgV (UPF0045/DUF77 family)
VLAEIQVLPTPAGTAQSPYAAVKAAIAVVQASGLTYEVGALGTTVQGAPDEVWALLRAVHDAALVAGAQRVGSVIKVHQHAGDVGPTIADLIGSYRT